MSVTMQTSLGKILSAWRKTSARTEGFFGTNWSRPDVSSQDPVAFHEQRLKRIAHSQAELHKRYVQA